jgi:transcriptional regulator with XRE-family HTH domain
VPFNQEQSRLLKDLGANIRRERMARKITQERLAELVEVNPRTIQKIEAGSLNILVTTLARLHEALGCGWEQLMARAEVPRSRKK